MSTQLFIIIAIGLYFIVRNTESQRQKDKKTKKTIDLGRTPLHNASYYWPFDNIEPSGKENIVHELKKRKKRTFVRNGVKLRPIKQLGYALVLSGNQEWIDIKDLQDPCIWKVECPTGISVGFWINFVSGDYILAAGGYAGMKTVTNGFRLQRDKQTKYHTLEVANKKYKWQIYIEPFPVKKWVYLSFSWKQEYGLKLYFNGELTFTSTNPIPLRGVLQKRNSDHSSGNVMFIGRIDNSQEFNSSGNFMIAHLAIWKEVLTEDKFRAAYSANVKMSPKVLVCCYKVRENFLKDPCHAKKSLVEWDKVQCICPMYTTKATICEKVVKAKISSGCKNKLKYCRKLVDNQDYCDTKEPRYHNLCRETCGNCGLGMASTRSEPLQHFSEKTLIFALLGCVGGLVVLFGVTVYFWKVYRTRCYPSETKGREFLM